VAAAWYGAVVINGSHTIIYAEDAEQARAFFRDVLEYPYVDVHDGWLIFKLPPAELGLHPESEETAGSQERLTGRHELFLMCSDLEATVADLEAKGVVFTAPVEDQGFGLITRFRVPGAGELSLYQPKHPTAYDLPAVRKMAPAPRS
jgi:catechol 2,3-dioxygenase-like lactoylglutathione lyase family enzyme